MVLARSAGHNVLDATLVASAPRGSAVSIARSASRLRWKRASQTMSGICGTSGLVRYDREMIFHTNLEVHAFRLPLAAAVAARIGVFGFGPQAEDDLRTSIQGKGPQTLELMDAFFEKLVQRAQASERGDVGDEFWKLTDACESARKQLVDRTTQLCK